MMWWKEEKRTGLAILTVMVFMLTMLFGGMPAYAEAAELTVSDITESSFKVSWPAASEPVEKYKVEVSNTVTGTVYDIVTSLEYIVEGLDPGKSYDVKVTAKPASATWEGGVTSLQKNGITTLTSATVPSAEITSNGDISLKFSKAMADLNYISLTAIQDQFNVEVVRDEVYREEVAVQSIENTNTTGKIKLVLVNKVQTGQKVTITYTKGADASQQLKYEDGTAVDDFVAQIGTQIPDQSPVSGLVVFQKPYALSTGITKGVGIEGEFEVGFTEQIKPNSLTVSINKTGTLKGSLPEKVPVAFTPELIANNALKIKTNNPLEYGTCYELVIGSGLKGVSGAKTEADSKVEFCTVAFNEPTYKITRDGQEVTTVAVGQTYKLEATLTNCSDKTQTVDAVLQLRGGKGARNIYGGYIISQSVQTIEVKKGASTDVTLEFTVPNDLDSFYLYGDIFVWEKVGSPASAMPFHFNCPVE
jgi:hypothetical protein